MAPRDVEAQEPLLNGEDAEACPSSGSWLLFWYDNKGRQSGGGEPGVPVSEKHAARLMVEAWESCRVEAMHVGSI